MNLSGFYRVFFYASPAPLPSYAPLSLPFPSLSLPRHPLHPHRNLSDNYSALCYPRRWGKRLSYRSIYCNIASMSGYLPLSLQSLSSHLLYPPNVPMQEMFGTHQAYVRLCPVNTWLRSARSAGFNRYLTITCVYWCIE